MNKPPSASQPGPPAVPLVGHPPAASEGAAAAPPPQPGTGIVQVAHLVSAEHAWEAMPGTVLLGSGFNGQVPGPIIEATVGDTLVVRFTNRLREPSGICWPGLSSAIAAGATVGQGHGEGSHPPNGSVPPGGSQEYRLELGEAGTFWYRPPLRHSRRHERGLYGTVVVRSPDEPVVDGERVLLVDQVDLARHERYRASRSGPGMRRQRVSNLLLVNGVHQPRMLAEPGQVERWRLVNVSRAQHLRLLLTGPPVHAIRCNGASPRWPDRSGDQSFAPGDRLDLLVGPLPPGSQMNLWALPDPFGPDDPRPLRLATVHLERGAPPQ